MMFVNLVGFMRMSGPICCKRPCLKALSGFPKGLKGYQLHGVMKANALKYYFKSYTLLEKKSLLSRHQK